VGTVNIQQAFVKKNDFNLRFSHSLHLRRKNIGDNGGGWMGERVNEKAPGLEFCPGAFIFYVISYYIMA
jgi:hypothetical protein